MRGITYAMPLFFYGSFLKPVYILYSILEPFAQQIGK